MTAKFIVGVAFSIERDGAILMLRRSPMKDHAAGEWEFGSGRVEYGEHPEEAVHREVREETSLEIDIVEPVATFHFYRGDTREEAVGITFWCRYRAGELTPSEEHDRAIWVSPTEAKALVSFPGGAEAIDRVARKIGGREFVPVSPPMTHRVFVYGSLKRGYWNSALLSDSVFKGETVTEQRYYMLSGRVEGSRAFPVILDDDPALSTRPVKGEIYHVSDECMAQLDRLERVPDSYERKIADVTEDGYPVKAHIYVGNPVRWRRSGWPLWTGLNENGALVWIEQ